MSVDLNVEAAQAELGFGRYQLQHLVLCLLPLLFSGVYVSNYVFAAADVEYRCLVPECETQPLQYKPGEWGQWALPDEKTSRCHRYVPVTTNESLTETGLVIEIVRDGSKMTTDSTFISDLRTLEGGSCVPTQFTNETERCDAWVYESNDTIVAEFNLACEDWKRTLVGTVHSAGFFVALIFIGLLSDRFGRRTVFVGVATCPAVVGLARALCNSYPAYVALEFVESLLGSGAFTAGFVLVTETTSEKYRVLTSNLVPVAFSLGLVVLAGVSWVLPAWRYLLLALYLPSCLFLAYCILLDESPRWLAARGRTAEAAAILLRAARVNKVTFSPKLNFQLLEVQREAKVKKECNTTLQDSEKTPSIAKQVIRSKLLMCRLAMCTFWWMTCTFIFYGLSITSVSLSGNKYVNFMLSALAEIPGYVLSVLTVDRFGRRSSIAWGLVFCGAALISVSLVPEDLSSVQISLTLLGKVWVSMSFSSLYIFTSELFPTQARHSLLATCSMVGRVGQILAPQTPLLILIWQPLPYVIFGIMSILSALLMLLAPETRHNSLPDTVDQCEQSARSQTVTNTS